MITNRYDKPRNLRFACTNTPSDSFQIHYHSVYELYYFVSGDADYLVEGKQYHLTPHSLLLLSPNTLHGVRVNSEQDYVRCAVNFSPEELPAENRSLLLSPFPGNQKNSPKEVFYEQTQAFDLKGSLEQLILSQKQPVPLCTQYYPIYLAALLAQITIMCQTLRPTQVTSSAPDVIHDILSYLSDHISEHITLDDLSRRFFISKYYLNRAFRKATGTTVMDYLIYKRVILARQLMLNGATAADAALQAGFGDYSVFYRAYRKLYGCGPSADLRGDPARSH